MLLSALRAVARLRPTPIQSRQTTLCAPHFSHHRVSVLRASLPHLRNLSWHSRFRSAPTRSLQSSFFTSDAAASGRNTSLPILAPRSVGTWLMISSTLVFAIVVVGGVTRLTESGLSITEWRPITGVLPPLSREEWIAEFEKYKTTPEFKLYVSSNPW